MYTQQEILKIIERFCQTNNTLSSSSFDDENNAPSLSTVLRRFGSWGNAVDAAGLPHDFVECPACGDLHEYLGIHWRWNPKCRPKITERQDNIVRGLLLGDGYCTKPAEGRDSLISAEMTNREFLGWIDKGMGIMGKGVKQFDSGSIENRVRRSIESGFNPIAKEKNYSEVYYWSSVSPPKFNEYRRDWYPDGEKEFPTDLKLTPVILAVWFCGDGSKEGGTRQRPFIKIANTSQLWQKELIVRIFDEIGVSPSFKKRGSGFWFSPDDSEFLWDWMDEPLPGFKYKWPQEDDFIPEQTRWQEGEVDILRNEYPARGINIGELDRSTNAIYNKARRLGIKYDFED